MRKKMKALPSGTSGRRRGRSVLAAAAAAALALSAVRFAAPVSAAANGGGGEAPEVTISVCSWEEYIDLGDWDEDETIDLPSGDIIGEQPMVTDFEEWYYETYGIRVNVEYSTFGTNEDLYNMLTLGDVFDLVCPAEYMIMKLMAEDRLVPLSDAFYDESDPNNYYINGVSPYIRELFEENEINGESWSKYAAGYMWGVTGIVYNPEKVTEEDASTWKILNNPDYRRQVTVKDNVRDTYFAAVGAIKSDLLTSEEFRSAPDYPQRLTEEMNDVSEETIARVLDYLQEVKKNTYSFETDSGKSDMVTGKVLANLQWSGDGVYSLDQAEEDGLILAFAVPEEVTNIYFDGWCLLKNGIGQDPGQQELKQHACEAFINFLSRPDNVIRNMYYVGYTSVIAGGDDPRIFEYLDWCYGAEEDEEAEEEAGSEEDEASEDEALVEYPVGYFFTGDNSDEDYIVTTTEEQTRRQLFSQYPTEDVLARSSIMVYFDAETNDRINQMWINVRCFDVRDVPPAVWAVLAAGAVLVVLVLLGRRKRRREYM